jgi:GGDEF domain-containing protein
MVGLLKRSGQLRRWLRRSRSVLAFVALGGTLFAASFAAHSIESARAAATIVAAVGMLGYTAVLLIVTQPMQRVRESELRRLEHHGRRLVIYDRETGLYAYWYFVLRLEEEVARARRYGQPFGILLVEASRARLSRADEGGLVETLRSSFRVTDMVCHMGNLRFLVLLSNTDADGVRIVHERLGERLAAGGTELGRAVFPDDGVDLAALVRSAEAAAKAA